MTTDNSVICPSSSFSTYIVRITKKKMTLCQQQRLWNHMTVLKGLDFDWLCFRRYRSIRACPDQPTYDPQDQLGTSLLTGVYDQKLQGIKTQWRCWDKMWDLAIFFFLLIHFVTTGNTEPNQHWEKGRSWKLNIFYLYFYITLTLIHLADPFVQSNIQIR